MQIKTYKGKRIEKQHFFFIQSKGNNSGKPLDQPIANCYLVITETKEERDFYYWLCYGLWQAKKFQPVLCGSVVSFIRIHDLKAILSEAEQKVREQPQKFEKALKTLIKVNQCYDDAKKQLSLLNQAKTLLMFEVLK